MQTWSSVQIWQVLTLKLRRGWDVRPISANQGYCDWLWRGQWFLTVLVSFDRWMKIRSPCQCWKNINRTQEHSFWLMCSEHLCAEVYCCFRVQWESRSFPVALSADASGDKYRQAGTRKLELCGNYSNIFNCHGASCTMIGHDQVSALQCRVCLNASSSTDIIKLTLSNFGAIIWIIFEFLLASPFLLWWVR